MAGNLPPGKDTPRIRSFERLLAGAGSIITLSHIQPDGDAIGSSFAMQTYIHDILGKECTSIFPSRIPRTLEFIRDGEKCVSYDLNPLRCKSLIEKADLIICLDFNTFSRLGGELQATLSAVRCPKVLIDHHVGPDEECFEMVFSDTAASSTCELLYQILLRTSPIGKDARRLPLRCAGSLLTGMTTDTNNFSNSTTPDTLRMAADLLECGVDRDAILRNVNQSYRIQRLHLLGHILSDLLHIIPLPCGGSACYFVLPQSTLTSYGIVKGETEGMVNIPLSVKDIVLSICAKEDDDTGNFRISSRSKEGISAREVCVEHFCGGGHELAAGGIIYVGRGNASKEGADKFAATADDIGAFIEDAIRKHFNIGDDPTPTTTSSTTPSCDNGSDL